MTVAKVVVAQRDFSAGELDPQIKRADDHPLMKSGARQMSNWRILNSRGFKNRPGRRALFLDGPRIDEVLMSPSNPFFLAFGNGYLRVYNASGALVFDSGNVPVKPAWTRANIPTIVWDAYKLTIYITYSLIGNSNTPLVLTWDGISQTSTWTLSLYAEDVISSGQKRTIFYRLSPIGITLQPTPPVGGSVNGLVIGNRGIFPSVPSVTISPPGAGGTTATASATLRMFGQGTLLATGTFSFNPTGANVYFPDGITLLVQAAFQIGGLWSINNYTIVQSGSLSSGSAPSSLTATAADGAGFIVAPVLAMQWELSTLTLTNGGGSGYLTIPTVSLSPTGNTTTVTATISGTGVATTTLTFSAGMTLTNAYIGTRIRFTNRQILITGVTSATVATGIIEEPLYPSGIYGTTTNQNLNLFFSVGQEIIGQTSNAKAVVVSISANGLQMTVQYLNGSNIVSGEIVAGPAGSLKIDSIVSQNLAPAATTVWDDEVMNNFRGWPRSCFVDQGRLGFCDFPSLPGLIGWSFQGEFTDQYTDANNASPVNAIQELAPGKSRVLFVVPGAEGSEFVFCDNAVYYIPINQTTPLQPGSVAFNTLISDGAAQVKPQRAQQSVVYVSAGSQQLRAVQPIGAYSRPYIIDDLTEVHGHLLNGPVAIACPGGSAQFEERYVYVVNSDGSMIVGKYEIANGLINPKTIGWLPWSGGGSATWAAARGPDVVFTGTYAPNSITAVSVVEMLDASQFLDAAILYNNVPSGITTPGGKGPLWWLAGGAVDLMDGGRMMGTYQIDANGNLIAQNNAGENFSSTTLACGQAWTAIFEPFVPPVQPGQDANQRLRKRRIQRHEVYVKDSTGFVMARLSGASTARPSYPTTLSVLCTGTATTVLPAGPSSFATIKDPNGNLFQCIQAGTIPASGSIVLNFAAVGAGPIPIPTKVTIAIAISGWTAAAVISGSPGRTFLSPGTILKQKRIATWNQDEDPTQAPPLREQSYSDRPIGRMHDPRVAIIKDTPGSLTILEDDLEVSV